MGLQAGGGSKAKTWLARIFVLGLLVVLWRTAQLVTILGSSSSSSLVVLTTGEKVLPGVVPIRYPVSRFGAGEINGEEVQLCIIAGGNTPRRLEEIRASIYSLLLERTCPIKLHIVEDQEAHLGLFKQLWQPLMAHEPKFSIRFYNLTLGLKQHCQFKDNFYAGSRAKACLDAILPPQVDRVIVLDSDSLVFEDIRNLWAEFDNFTEAKSQFVLDPPSSPPGGRLLKPEPDSLKNLEGPAFGIAFEMTDHYDTHHVFAADPARLLGFNGGLVILRLERLRSIGWAKLWKEELTLTAQDQPLELGDQDIWNVMYRYSPRLCYRIPSSWNVQLLANITRPNFSKRFQITEINVVHGNYGALWRNYRHWQRAFAFLHPDLEEARQVARTFFRRELSLLHRAPRDVQDRLANFLVSEGHKNLLRLTTDEAVGYQEPLSGLSHAELRNLRRQMLRKKRPDREQQERVGIAA